MFSCLEKSLIFIFKQKRVLNSCVKRSKTSLLQRSGKTTTTGFGALPQVIGRTAIPFLKKYVVPGARRIGADMLGFAVPKIADVVSGKQNFKADAKNVGRQTLKNNSVVEVGKVLRAKSFSPNPRSGTVGRAEI